MTQHQADASRRPNRLGIPIGIRRDEAAGRRPDLVGQGPAATPADRIVHGVLGPLRRRGLGCALREGLDIEADAPDQPPPRPRHSAIGSSQRSPRARRLNPFNPSLATLVASTASDFGRGRRRMTLNARSPCQGSRDRPWGPGRGSRAGCGWGRGWAKICEENFETRRGSR